GPALLRHVGLVDLRDLRRRPVADTGSGGRGHGRTQHRECQQGRRADGGESPERGGERPPSGARGRVGHRQSPLLLPGRLSQTRPRGAAVVRPLLSARLALYNTGAEKVPRGAARAPPPSASGRPIRPPPTTTSPS